MPAAGSVGVAVLDAEQQRAVDLPADTSLVVDGEAGVGKTLGRAVSIGVARSPRARQVAAVSRARARADRGPAPVVRLMADRLEIPKLDIAVLDDWLVGRAQGVHRLAERLAKGATAQVIALKRHPAVREVLGRVSRLETAARRRQAAAIARAAVRILGDAPRLQRVVEASGLPARAIRDDASTRGCSSRPRPSARIATSTPRGWSRSTAARSMPGRRWKTRTRSMRRTCPCCSS